MWMSKKWSRFKIYKDEETFRAKLHREDTKRTLKWQASLPHSVPLDWCSTRKKHIRSSSILNWKWLDNTRQLCFKSKESSPLRSQSTTTITNNSDPVLHLPSVPICKLIWCSRSLKTCNLCSRSRKKNNRSSSRSLRSRLRQRNSSVRWTRQEYKLLEMAISRCKSRAIGRTLKRVVRVITLLRCLQATHAWNSTQCEIRSPHSTECLPMAFSK